MGKTGRNGKILITDVVPYHRNKVEIETDGLPVDTERAGLAKALIALAQERGVNTDPHIRQELAQLHSMGEVTRYTHLRSKAASAARVKSDSANVAPVTRIDSMLLSKLPGMSLSVSPSSTQKLAPLKLACLKITNSVTAAWAKPASQNTSW